MPQPCGAANSGGPMRATIRAVLVASALALTASCSTAVPGTATPSSQEPVEPFPTVLSTTTADSRREIGRSALEAELDSSLLALPPDHHEIRVLENGPGGFRLSAPNGFSEVWS